MILPSQLSVALITGSGALVVSALTWAQSVRITRLNGKLNRELEAYKHDNSKEIEILKGEATQLVELSRLDVEKRKTAIEISLREAKPIRDALNVGFASIQAIKDEIRILAAPGVHFSEMPRQTIKLAIDQLVNDYRQLGGSLPERARDAFHDAKSLAVNTINTIDLSVADGDRLSFDESGIAMLTRTHESLTEYQVILLQVSHEHVDELFDSIVSKL